MLSLLVLIQLNMAWTCRERQAEAARSVAYKRRAEEDAEEDRIEEEARQQRLAEEEAARQAEEARLKVRKPFKTHCIVVLSDWLHGSTFV